jgi:hypothetical protein
MSRLVPRSRSKKSGLPDSGGRSKSITGEGSLPTAPAARKGIPLYSGLIRYFPNALIAVAELSRIGNDQHNPGKPVHWDRSKSGDELDALARHLVEAGTFDTDKVRHSTKLAWRSLANLQKEIERDRRPPGRMSNRHR